MSHSLIVKIQFNEFKQWLYTGVGLFQFIKDEIENADSKELADSDQVDLKVGLPCKYQSYAESQSPGYLLIDEIDSISLETEELTNEWEARMHNLGEAWLPFEFHPDWRDVPVWSLVSGDVRTKPNQTMQNEKSSICPELEDNKTKDKVKRRKKPKATTIKRKKKEESEEFASSGQSTGLSRGKQNIRTGHPQQPPLPSMDSSMPVSNQEEETNE